MKNIFIGILLASVFILPAEAGNSNNNTSHHHGSGDGWSGGSGGGFGGGSASSAGSSSTANGGGGGAGGTGTGGSATGGAATGGSASGGQSSASGNTSTVSVSLTSGSSSGSSSGGDPNASTVKYDGSYTVKSAPPIAAPSLTSTFSDTCMGSASFGLSFVGFGATGGSTMVDEACVRRLDSREFRAMGLNDVALALLCQSDANRKAVEAAGHACPSATVPVATAATAAVTALALTNSGPVRTQADQQVSLALPAETPLPAEAPAAPAPASAPAPVPAPVPQPVAAADPAVMGTVPEQPRVAALEMKALAEEAGGK